MKTQHIALISFLIRFGTTNYPNIYVEIIGLLFGLISTIAVYYWIKQNKESYTKIMKLYHIMIALIIYAVVAYSYAIYQLLIILK